MRISEKDMFLIVGGTNITGTIINAFSTIFKTIYSIGQGAGGAMRRIVSGNLCKL